MPRRKWLTFTVVREPLAHFESGFSEVSWRVKDASKSGPSVKCCQAWWRHGTSAAERAPAFLADYLSGRIFDLWCCPADHDTDLHVLPQVAFLTHAQSFVPGGRLHRILRLESLGGRDGLASLFKVVNSLFRLVCFVWFGGPVFGFLVVPNQGFEVLKTTDD